MKPTKTVLRWNTYIIKFTKFNQSVVTKWFSKKCVIISMRMKINLDGFDMHSFSQDLIFDQLLYTSFY